MSMCGEIDYQNARIRLSKDVNPQVARAVFLHEVLHGVFYQGGYSNHEEDTILLLGYSLLAVLRNNPALMEFLTQ